LTQTDANGEIVVLDSAGYGAVTISQSVAIIAPRGVYAGVSVPNGNGITVNGGNIKVTLRGLTINGQGGNDGISVALAGVVHIENCTITNMAGDGVDIADDGAILIKDSLIRDNSGVGVHLRDTASVSTLRIDRTRIERNGEQGIYVEPTSTLTVIDSTIADNGSEGVVTKANSGQTIAAEIIRTLVRGNGGAGISTNSYDGGVAVGAISDSVVSYNQGHGIDAHSNSADTRVAVDRTVMMGNVHSGVASTNSTTTVIVTNNVSLRNGTGMSRHASSVIKTLGNNLVEENTVDTNSAFTVVTGK
jgi:hypothetical protein